LLVGFIPEAVVQGVFGDLFAGFEVVWLFRVVGLAVVNGFLLAVGIRQNGVVEV
jgi:hypothetical protein